MLVFWPLVLAAIVAAMQLSSAKSGIALAAPKPAPGTVLAFPLAHLWFLYVLLGLYILLLAVRSLMLALPVRGRRLSVAKLRSRPVAC